MWVSGQCVKICAAILLVSLLCILLFYDRITNNVTVIVGLKEYAFGNRGSNQQLPLLRGTSSLPMFHVCLKRDYESSCLETREFDTFERVLDPTDCFEFGHHLNGILTNPLAFHNKKNSLKLLITVRSKSPNSLPGSVLTTLDVDVGTQELDARKYREVQTADTMTNYAKLKAVVLVKNREFVLKRIWNSLIGEEESKTSMNLIRRLIRHEYTTPVACPQKTNFSDMQRLQSSMIVKESAPVVANKQTSAVTPETTEQTENSTTMTTPMSSTPSHSEKTTAIMIGLTVGLALLVILFVILAAYVYIRRNRIIGYREIN